jgi:hypothetical protein
MPLYIILKLVSVLHAQVSDDLLPIGTKIWKELETTICAIKLITEREDLLGNNPVSICWGGMLP